MTTSSLETVRFHGELYTRPAVDAAIESFADFATFRVLDDGDHIAVEIGDISEDVEGDVIAEFCNFVLANSVGNRPPGA